MKQQKALFLTMIIFFLLFSGCFSSWQEDTGTIILNLSGNGRALDNFPPKEGQFDELKYEITFTGANDEFTLNSMGSQLVKTTVTSGKWMITVKAYTEDANWVSAGLTRTEYAFGRETVIVKPGQYNPVTVKMSNKSVVEIKFLWLLGDNYQVEDYKFSMIFVLRGEQKLCLLPGKGPHLIELEGGGTWEINVLRYEQINGDENGTPEKTIINDVIYDSKPYTDVINPGDYKILHIKLSN